MGLASTTSVKYGEFVCQVCGHLYAERIPPFCSDLPACPLCGKPSNLNATLQRCTWKVDLALGLVLLTGCLHVRATPRVVVHPYRAGRTSNRCAVNVQRPIWKNVHLPNV